MCTLQKQLELSLLSITIPDEERLMLNCQKSCIKLHNYNVNITMLPAVCYVMNDVLLLATDCDKPAHTCVHGMDYSAFKQSVHLE